MIHMLIRLWLSLRLPALPAVILALCLADFSAAAQSDPLYTQSWALPTLYNPAATGTTDFLRIRAAGRLQWVGIENAPQKFHGSCRHPF